MQKQKFARGPASKPPNRDHLGRPISTGPSASTKHHPHQHSAKAPRPSQAQTYPYDAYIAPCIVEFFPPDVEPDPTALVSSRTYIGSLPHATSTAHDEPGSGGGDDDDDDDNNNFPAHSSNARTQTGPSASRVQMCFGLDHAFEEDEDEDPDPDEYGPLVWLRVPLRTLCPAMLRGRQPAAEREACVYLVLPATAWYPELPKKRKNATRARSAEESEEEDEEMLRQRQHRPGSITFRRYDEPEFRVPKYVREAMADAGLSREEMCAVDVEPVLRPRVYVPGKWMRLGSVVENVLLGDLRALAEADGFRVHLPWSAMCEWRVRDTAMRVQREVEASDGACAKLKLYKLFPDERNVGAGAWENFLPWDPKGQRGFSDEIINNLFDRKVSSSVDELEISVREGRAQIKMERERSKAKKRKPFRGFGVGGIARKVSSSSVDVDMDDSDSDYAPRKKRHSHMDDD